MSRMNFQQISSQQNSFIVLKSSKKFSIRTSKLPKDFFASHTSVNKSCLDSLEGLSTQQNSPRLIKTPAFGELNIKRRKLLTTEKRTASTARDQQPKAEDLIRDVIDTSRNLSRNLRKKSVQFRSSDLMEMKGQNRQKQFSQKLPSLPLIVNRRYGNVHLNEYQVKPLQPRLNALITHLVF